MKKRSAKLSEIRSQVRNLGKRKRRASETQSAMCVDGRELPQHVLLVFVLANHEACVAADFLCGRGRGSHGALDAALFSAIDRSDLCP